MLKTHIDGLMPSEQQMIAETIHQQIHKTFAQFQDSVRLPVYQAFRINTALDVLHMSWSKNYKIRRKWENEQIEQE